jgi:hypothetical protein
MQIRSYRRQSSFRYCLDEYELVMAGLVRAIHVFLVIARLDRAIQQPLHA